MTGKPLEEEVEDPKPALATSESDDNVPLAQSKTAKKKKPAKSSAVKKEALEGDDDDDPLKGLNEKSAKKMEGAVSNGVTSKKKIVQKKGAVKRNGKPLVGVKKEETQDSNDDEEDERSKKEKKNKKKKTKEIKKVVSKKSALQVKVKKERKVYNLPGQKHDPPEERDPLRIFYETLYQQLPTSEMAAFWMMEWGLLPPEEAKKVYETKLKRSQLHKLGSPVKKVISVKKKATNITVAVKEVKRTLSETSAKKTPKKRKMAGGSECNDDEDFELMAKKKKKTLSETSAKKTPKKMASGSESDDDDDEDFESTMKKTKKKLKVSETSAKKTPKKMASGSESDDDDDDEDFESTMKKTKKKLKV